MTRHVRLLTLGAVSALLAGILGVLPSQASAAELSLQDAIASLPVAAEDRTGYQRTAFRHWIDEDKDGCNTRAEVLIAEATIAPTVGAGCTISGGQWLSYYDNKTFNIASALDIDHMVPLAEAWDSGASEWTVQRRQDYANDLDDDRSLVAVTAAANRSKADQDPATWMPPLTDATCHYLTDWVTTKIRWKLTIDNTEREALNQRSADCTDTVSTNPA